MMHAFTPLKPGNWRRRGCRGRGRGSQPLGWDRNPFPGGWSEGWVNKRPPGPHGLTVRSRTTGISRAECGRWMETRVQTAVTKHLHMSNWSHFCQRFKKLYCQHVGGARRWSVSSCAPLQSECATELYLRLSARASSWNLLRFHFQRGPAWIDCKILLWGMQKLCSVPLTSTPLSASTLCIARRLCGGFIQRRISRPPGQPGVFRSPGGFSGGRRRPDGSTAQAPRPEHARAWADTCCSNIHGAKKCKWTPLELTNIYEAGRTPQ